MGLGTYLCTEKAYFAGFLVKMAFSDKEAEDWGAGPFPGSHSHYVTEWEPHLCPTPTPLLRSQLFVCSPLPTHQGLQKCMTFKKYLFI